MFVIFEYPFSDCPFAARSNSGRDLPVRRRKDIGLSQRPIPYRLNDDRSAQQLDQLAGRCLINLLTVPCLLQKLVCIKQNLGAKS